MTTQYSNIQIRRRNNTSGAPSSLLSGELAYNAVDNIVYIGQGDNGQGVATTIARVGGAGAYVLSSLIGSSNGIASLDNTGRVSYAQLPAALTGLSGALVYQGTWNPATNTPTLLSGVGTKGFYYKASVGGTTITQQTNTTQVSAGTSLSFASTTGITVGMLVTGTNVGANTTVSSVTSNGIVLSASTTAIVPNQTSLTFNSYLDGDSSIAAGDIFAFNGTTWDRLTSTTGGGGITSVAGHTGPTVTLASSDLTDSTTAGRALLTSSTVALQRTSLKIDAYTVVNDVAYQMANTDTNVQYSNITAARVVTLPPASAYNAGQRIRVGDSSGSASSTNTITVVRNGSDIINGASNKVITTAYGQLDLMSNGVNFWVVGTSASGSSGSNSQDDGTF